MSETLRPETNEQLLDAVKWATAEKSPLEIVAMGSKRAFGRPMQTAATLDMSGLSRIKVYEPAELFMTAAAGASMSDVTQALEEAGQQLSFEPPDLGPLLGDEAGKGSIGGVVATNIAGPRRIKEGAARDHVLGFNAVSGRGEVFKSGGTVVKNVTGFDLSKLMAGSFGTLAVMSEVTLKTLPAPEKTRTILVSWKADGIYAHAAMSAMAKALGSPHDVSAAAHLPAAVAKRSRVDYVAGAAGAVTAVRVEGPEPSVKHRTETLIKELKLFGDIEELHTSNSKTFWREVRDVQAFVGRDDLPVVWRLSVPPMSGSHTAIDLLEELRGEVMYDWGGGLIWLGLASEAADANADFIRNTVARVGGHATLVRASAASRSNVPVFQPLSSAEQMVTEKINEGFDPNGVLNPGRMYQGI
jgi:glycolate oxidase FAD binding subunit